MQKLVFTLCSNNYLAHAKSLCDSVAAQDPGMKIVIGLVDEFDKAIDYSFFQPYEILPFNTIGFSCFEEMLGQYNVIEFNTAVKPYYFEYFFTKYGEGTQVLYLDPDLIFYQSTASLFDVLDEHAILLTPNLTEVKNELAPGELASLRHGMYNLGFVGVANVEPGRKFIQWWMARLRTHCTIDKCRGIFVDQKWVDLAPLYFDKLYITYNKGYNMAWWNLNERSLVSVEDKHFVNDEKTPLTFFHFSGYKHGSDFFTERHKDNSDYALEMYPGLQKLFKDYSERLIANNYEQFWVLRPQLSFGHSKKVQKKGIMFRIGRKIMKVIGNANLL